MYPATPALALNTADVAQAGYWSSWYSDVFVAAPGCYAVQIDTHDKSQVIVFLAQRAAQ